MHSTSQDADLQLDRVLWEMQFEDLEVHTAAAPPNPNHARDLYRIPIYAQAQLLPDVPVWDIG